MKKLCFITTVPITLKTFVLEQAICLHQAHADYVITFICDTDDTFRDELPDYIRYLPVPMSRGVDIHGIRTVFALTKIFRREKFDLIQYATPNAALYASLAGRMAGVRKRLYCQWGIRYVGFSGMRRFIFNLLEKITCRNSVYINAVSPRNRQFAIDEGLYPPEKAKVVGNGGTIGVDLTRYDPENAHDSRARIRESLSISPDSFVFGFVGRLSRDKGSIELFRAVQHISAIRNIRLLCVGSSELVTALPPDLLDFMEHSGVILFTGQIPSDRVPEYYAAMDAYVHPTYREGFGMVLQEAAAMGCPVITTDIPGACEVLDRDVSCLLAQPRDVDSLAVCMLRLTDDPDLCRQLGIAGRKKAEECYERGQMLSRQLARYEEILGE